MIKSAVDTKPTPMRDDHAPIGTWISKGKLRVSGFCRSDGEELEVKEVKWDGKALSFTARMPSTDTVTGNLFRVRPDGSVDLELTTYEFWKKRM